MTSNVKRAFKYRFYPTDEQAQLLARTFGCVRVVYNKALEERSRAWTMDQRRVSYEDTAKLLTAWKTTDELSFLTEVSIVPLQQTLRHLQTAFMAFWAKNGKYPRLKSRKRSKDSATFTSNGFVWRGGQLTMAKMTAPLNIVWSRPLPDGAAPSSVTVSRDRAGRYFVSILVEDAIQRLSPAGKNVGIDLGVKTFAVLSDSEHLPIPDFTAQKERIKRAQKNLDRKTKGSSNRHKARHKLARAHARLSDAKRDFLHKTSTRLIRENQTIAIEDLTVRNMSRSAKGTIEKPGRNIRQKAGLNREILAGNWAEFRSMLEYKAGWYGRDLVAIDRSYPSSKQCSACGHLLDHLELKVRSWRCPSCRAVHDRDVNAAKNILAAGLAATACGDGVRLRA